MTWQEWENLTIQTLGEEALSIMNKLFLGEITFEKCLADIWDATPPENIRKFMYMINCVEEAGLLK